LEHKKEEVETATEAAEIIKPEASSEETTSEKTKPAE
jgi:hypothetical protein